VLNFSEMGDRKKENSKSVLVASELLVRFVMAHQVVRVALVDGWHTAEFAMVPNVA
jgi:hypothetical protein